MRSFMFVAAIFAATAMSGCSVSVNPCNTVGSSCGGALNGCGNTAMMGDCGCGDASGACGCNQTSACDSGCGGGMGACKMGISRFALPTIALPKFSLPKLSLGGCNSCAGPCDSAGGCEVSMGDDCGCASGGIVSSMGDCGGCNDGGILSGGMSAPLGMGAGIGGGGIGSHLAGLGCGKFGCGKEGKLCMGCKFRGKGRIAGIAGKAKGAVGGIIKGGHPYGGAIPHTAPGQAMGGMGGGAPQYAYPYYTTRGPRDFLDGSPMSIGR